MQAIRLASMFVLCAVLFCGSEGVPMKNAQAQKDQAEDQAEEDQAEEDQAESSIGPIRYTNELVEFVKSYLEDRLEENKNYFTWTDMGHAFRKAIICGATTKDASKLPSYFEALVTRILVPGHVIPKDLSSQFPSMFKNILTETPKPILVRKSYIPEGVSIPSNAFEVDSDDEVPGSSIIDLSEKFGNPNVGVPESIITDLSERLEDLNIHKLGSDEDELSNRFACFNLADERDDD